MMPENEQNDLPPPKPKVKKTRINIPWTPAEEQQLKRMRDNGNSWNEIAKVRYSALTNLLFSNKTVRSSRRGPKGVSRNTGIR